MQELGELLGSLARDQEIWVILIATSPSCSQRNVNKDTGSFQLIAIK
jgi:hypothetical protein